MNKKNLYPIFISVALVLSACGQQPAKDVVAVSAAVDAATAGHYGQSVLHEEMAEENLETANRVLKHWRDDHYWNIDENQTALDAAQSAKQHRIESEKHLCAWLNELNTLDHHHGKVIRHTAAYFKTGSSTPFKISKRHVNMLGKYLKYHPEATADVTAYTDTVGSPESNQRLSERRAQHVKRLLINHGAKDSQLRVKAMGEAEGPDNTPNQDNRIVTVTAVPSPHGDHFECSAIQ